MEIRISLHKQGVKPGLFVHIVMANNESEQGKQDQEMFYTLLNSNHVKFISFPGYKPFAAIPDSKEERTGDLYLSGDENTQQASIEWILQKVDEYHAAPNCLINLKIDEDAGNFLGMKNHLSYAKIKQKTQNYLENRLKKKQNKFDFNNEAENKRWHLDLNKSRDIGLGGYSSEADQYPWYATSLTDDQLAAKETNCFKFHIAIDDAENGDGNMDPNLERGYDIADQILRQHHVRQYKVILPGVKLDDSPLNATQARKQMTIYSGVEGENRTTEQWEAMMDEIVLSFVDNNVKPKPELAGEQDVRVKGSSYLTYRNDDNDHIPREFGYPYKPLDDLTDPYQGIRLSDIFYKELLEASKIEITATLIKELMEKNIAQNEIKNSNIERIIRHVKNNKNITQDKQKIIVDVLEQQIQQKNIPLKDNYRASSSDISSYEVQTSYSKAAADYNQLVLLVCEAIKVNGALPQWWGSLTPSSRLLLQALTWQKIDQEWQKRKRQELGLNPDEDFTAAMILPPSLNVVQLDCDKLKALTSAEAIKTYATEKVTVADLIGLEIAKIKALTSDVALSFYEAELGTAADFIKLTNAEEIETAMLEKLDKIKLNR